jgi:hypothetical protein
MPFKSRTPICLAEIDDVLNTRLRRLILTREIGLNAFSGDASGSIIPIFFAGTPYYKSNLKPIEFMMEMDWPRGSQSLLIDNPVGLKYLSIQIEFAIRDKGYLGCSLVRKSVTGKYQEGISASTETLGCALASAVHYHYIQGSDAMHIENAEMYESGQNRAWDCNKDILILIVDGLLQSLIRNEASNTGLQRKLSDIRLILPHLCTANCYPSYNVRHLWPIGNVGVHSLEVFFEKEPVSDKDIMEILLDTAMNWMAVNNISIFMNNLKHSESVFYQEYRELFEKYVDAVIGATGNVVDILAIKESFRVERNSLTDNETFNNLTHAELQEIALCMSNVAIGKEYQITPYKVKTRMDFLKVLSKKTYELMNLE